ncbi:MAG TPA: HAMP domain-containing sensor histidine kinase [Vicinamibacterales bacterium]
MSDRHWYRSLYWRIGLGLVAFLALMLAAQGALYLWMTDRIAGSMPARDPRRLAVLVASDIAAALAANPDLNLQQYVRDQFGNVFQTFLVLMDDGRAVANHDDVPEELEAVRSELTRRPPPRRGLGPRFRGGPPPGFGPPREAGGRPEFRPPPPERGGRGPRPGGPPPPRPWRGEFAPIMIGGEPVGRVAVLPGGPPFARVVRELGPTMGLLGGGVLAVGVVVVAFVVFGPVRRRLRQVQDATERLGGGDLTARAPEHGGDEVAAVARSFNRMADELAARAHALELSDKARRQLLADVSHELMTPLTAMRGYIETLTMSELEVDAGTRQRYLGIVTEETHRLERIIGDLLDLARLEGSATAMRQEPVDVTAVFGRVAERHEREVRARGIQLVRQVASGAHMVTGDPDRLEQALQNLAANALRHTPDGGTLRLSADREGAGVRIVIRDSGPGIAADHLPLIFDRFYKVDVSRKATGGSGLGLSIVKAIVERHGGTIVAHNDNGAVFEIVLPDVSVRAEGAERAAEDFTQRRRGAENAEVR